MESQAGVESRKVAIVADSTSDLPADMAEGNGITLVRLSLAIGDRTYRDGDLTQREFFDLMGRAEKLPTTSAPAVGVFKEAFEQALTTAPQVLSMHISEKLSGTIEAARQAAESFGDRVQIFDSRNLSWGYGWQVLGAARAAAAGQSMEQVLSTAEKTRDAVRMLVGVDKLDNLAKGGRIGRVSALLGGLLNLKITFTVGRDGAFEPVGRIRGSAAALEHTLGWVREQMGDHTRGAFCVMHALSEDRANWLRERLESMFDVEEMHVVETGVVIATHTGTGWGVAFVPRD